MAFVAKSLRVVAPLSVGYDASTPAVNALVPRLLSYATPDALATVAAANYFNGAVVAGSPDGLMPGDTILIQHTTGGARGAAFRTVTSVAAGVVTIAALG